MLGKIITICSLLCIAQCYTPVAKVDIQAYTGRWYQVIGSELNFAFMRNGTCVTADYGLGDNNITVLNSQYYNDRLEQITGYAVESNSEIQGELKVYLAGVPVAGQYYIYDLGEMIENQYTYSIVSDELFFTLFVLVRNVSYYEMYLTDKLHQEVEKIGFHLIYDVDQSNCTYA
jgi:lipocalin